uniref:Uncharacterized protein n=1 Tax=Populus alba TaxID=43335 RepID=A0A4U5QPN5_POPAL|nr:hypothetical protein D5086_0000059160 [Populus alba]
MLAVSVGLGRYQDIIADENLEYLIGARSSRATTTTMPPSTGMTLGGFVGASLMTTTLTSPPPGISLCIIDDDHPKVSILPVAKGPNLKYVQSSSSLDSCSLLSKDFGELKDIWKLCLIGYCFGKPPGYTMIGKFMYGNPGHSGSTCLNLGVGPKDLHTKQVHVSSAGPLETIVDVKPVLGPPLGAYTRAAIGTWEANRRMRKAKLPRDATSDLPVLPRNPADSFGSDFFGNRKLGPPFSKSKDRSPPRRTGLIPPDTSPNLIDATLGTSAGKKPGNSWMIGPPPRFF